MMVSPGEIIARNPLSSSSRAAISFHVGNRHYPDGDNDRIRALENERTPWVSVDGRFPRFDTGDQPLMVDDKIAREVVVNSWFQNDKQVDPNDPAVHVITCSSLFTPVKKERLEEPFTFLRSLVKYRVFHASLVKQCESSFYSCQVHVKKWELPLSTYDLTRFPTCITRHGKRVLRIDASYNRIGKFENLDTFTELEQLNMKRNKIKKLEGLDSLINLKDLKLDNNQIKKIDGLDALKKLEYLDLPDNQIIGIDNLDNNLHLRYINVANNPGLPANACDKFEKDRERKKLPIVLCFSR